MKFLSVTLASCYCILILSSSVYAQNSIDSTITKDTKFYLANDTLISASGLKIYPGQKLILGEGSAHNGRYRSIVSKYAALVPNIWGRNNGYEYLIENYTDNKKGRKQMEALMPGQVFTIGKITRIGKNQFLFYFTGLSSDTNDYRCDILLALGSKELLFQ